MGIRSRLTEQIVEEEPYEDEEGYRETETNVHATEKPGQPIWKMTDLIPHPDRMFETQPALKQFEDPEFYPTLQTKIRAELKAISQDPTPKGIFSTKIGGRVIDLHAFEEYLLDVSTTENKIVTRYHTAMRTAIMKGYLKGEIIKGKVGGRR